MSKQKSPKPPEPAKEKLAKAIEACGPVLLWNLPIALMDTTVEAKVGFAVLTFGAVGIQLIIAMSAWTARTKLKS